MMKWVNLSSYSIGKQSRPTTARISASSTPPKQPREVLELTHHFNIGLGLSAERSTPLVRRIVPPLVGGELRPVATSRWTRRTIGSRTMSCSRVASARISPCMPVTRTAGIISATRRTVKSLYFTTSAQKRTDHVSLDGCQHFMIRDWSLPRCLSFCFQQSWCQWAS